MLKHVLLATCIMSATFGAEAPLESDKGESIQPRINIRLKNARPVVENPTRVSEILSMLSKPTRNISDETNLLIELMKISLMDFKYRFEVGFVNFDDFDCVSSYTFSDPAVELQIRSHSKEIIQALFQSISSPEPITDKLQILQFFTLPSVITPDILDAFLVPSQLSMFNHYMTPYQNERFPIMFMITLLAHSATEPQHFKTLQAFALKHLSEFLNLKEFSLAMYLYLAYAACETTPQFIHDLLIGLLNIIFKLQKSLVVLDYLFLNRHNPNETKQQPHEVQIALTASELFIYLKSYHNNQIMAIRNELNIGWIATQCDSALNQLISKRPNYYKYLQGNPAYIQDPNLPLSETEEQEVKMLLDQWEKILLENEAPQLNYD